MSYFRQVQRGVDFIEARLDAPIALGDVARAAGISQWHFMRIFKAMTGDTLKRYIRARRLSQSAHALLGTDRGILDVALEAGYDSQAAFSRAFKLAFDLPPNKFRRRGTFAPTLTKLRLDADYLSHITQRVSLTPNVGARPPVRMVGLRTLFTGPASEKNTLGTTLPALWAAFLPRIAEVEHRVPGPLYGVIHQTAAHSETLEYFAAAEVSAVPETLPKNMASTSVPAGAYARFDHRGAAQDLDHTVNYIYGTWLTGSGRRHSYGPDLEIYGAEYHPTRDDSLIEYCIPLR